MTPKEVKYDSGVIVGRFQVHELHDAHKKLIQTVTARHSKVYIFVGCSAVPNTEKNPLDFRSVQVMINEWFPDIEVYRIDDVPLDSQWSANLDREIGRYKKPLESVVLYGSRDSFVQFYKGKYPTIELESDTYLSGTTVRKQIVQNYTPTKDYRAGLIAATAYRYPTAYQTIDVAILNQNGTQILLAQKVTDGGKFRFIGGFSDPSSESLEEDVRREVAEEAGIEIGEIRYILSTRIDDWRYRDSKNCIKTAFFTARYVFGKPEGGDDVALVKWFELKDVNEQMLVPEHGKLFTKWTTPAKSN